VTLLCAVGDAVVTDDQIPALCECLIDGRTAGQLGSWTANSRQQTADRRQQTEDSRQQVTGMIEDTQARPSE
jgi:hypothetical protein